MSKSKPGRVEKNLSSTTDPPGGIESASLQYRYNASDMRMISVRTKHTFTLHKLMATFSEVPQNRKC